MTSGVFRSAIRDSGSGMFKSGLGFFFGPSPVPATVDSIESSNKSSSSPYSDSVSVSAVEASWCLGIRGGSFSSLGETDDVREEIREADCVVLPSYYREGTPKSLLEAASMGRPIITTDNVGCRDVVDDNINGFLCEPRNEHDLEREV